MFTYASSLERNGPIDVFNIRLVIFSKENFIMRNNSTTILPIIQEVIIARRKFHILVAS